MGFLDHSTNNIIIDAVLTDYGRQKLSENNGQFRIEFFSLGDDEVDYGIIKKYGRTVGKEKIVKNTPIFEAGTKSNTAMRYRMLTLPNPTIYRMPRLTLQTQQVGGNGNIALTSGGTTKNIEILQRIDANNDTVPSGLLDTTFTVYMNDRFLHIPGGSPLGAPEPITKTRAYMFLTNQASEFTITIASRSSDQLNNAAFAAYGIGGKITTPVTIVGDQTGLRLDFKVEISQR